MAYRPPDLTVARHWSLGKSLSKDWPIPGLTATHWSVDPSTGIPISVSRGTSYAMLATISKQRTNDHERLSTLSPTRVADYENLLPLQASHASITEILLPLQQAKTAAIELLNDFLKSRLSPMEIVLPRSSTRTEKHEWLIPAQQQASASYGMLYGLSTSSAITLERLALFLKQRANADESVLLFKAEAAPIDESLVKRSASHDGAFEWARTLATGRVPAHEISGLFTKDSIARFETIVSGISADLIAACEQILGLFPARTAPHEIESSVLSVEQFGKAPWEFVSPKLLSARQSAIEHLLPALQEATAAVEALLLSTVAFGASQETMGSLASARLSTYEAIKVLTIEQQTSWEGQARNLAQGQAVFANMVSVSGLLSDERENTQSQAHERDSRIESLLSKAFTSAQPDELIIRASVNRDTHAERLLKILDSASPASELLDAMVRNPTLSFEITSLLSQSALLIWERLTSALVSRSDPFESQQSITQSWVADIERLAQFLNEQIGQMSNLLSLQIGSESPDESLAKLSAAHKSTLEQIYPLTAFQGTSNELLISLSTATTARLENVISGVSASLIAACEQILGLFPARGGNQESESNVTSVEQLSRVPWEFLNPTLSADALAITESLLPALHQAVTAIEMEKLLALTNSLSLESVEAISRARAALTEILKSLAPQVNSVSEIELGNVEMSQPVTETLTPASSLLGGEREEGQGQVHERASRSEQLFSNVSVAGESYEHIVSIARSISPQSEYLLSLLREIVTAIEILRSDAGESAVAYEFQLFLAQLHDTIIERLLYLNPGRVLNDELLLPRLNSSVISFEHLVERERIRTAIREAMRELLAGGMPETELLKKIISISLKVGRDVPQEHLRRLLPIKRRAQYERAKKLQKERREPHEIRGPIHGQPVSSGDIDQAKRGTGQGHIVEETRGTEQIIGGSGQGRRAEDTQGEGHRQP